eukprot:TRINITY_DN3526_c0_g1_i11.p3 TRINITY_DN3526_c0_g1~~TRINITY_DN3526_c0_g1_i11.p3  ORF type:complete len:178 (+),score=24.61 TRINITY_DN3526_c0_g1_i11:136-669(+)
MIVLLSRIALSRMQFTVLLVAALELLQLVDAFLHKGYSKASANNRVAALNNQTKRCFGSCGDSSCDHCEQEAPVVHAFVSQNANGTAGQNQGSGRQTCECFLKTSECKCTEGCHKSAEMRICTEILGPCRCIRSPSATCECFGHCPRMETFEEACFDEPGCEWTGSWCQAQVGLMWD